MVEKIDNEFIRKYHNTKFEMKPAPKGELSVKVPGESWIWKVNNNNKPVTLKKSYLDKRNLELVDVAADNALKMKDKTTKEDYLLFIERDETKAFLNGAPLKEYKDKLPKNDKDAYIKELPPSEGTKEASQTPAQSEGTESFIVEREDQPNKKFMWISQKAKNEGFEQEFPDRVRTKDGKIEYLTELPMDQIKSMGGLDEDYNANGTIKIGSKKEAYKVKWTKSGVADIVLIKGEAPASKPVTAEKPTIPPAATGKEQMAMSNGKPEDEIKKKDIKIVTPGAKPVEKSESKKAEVVEEDPEEFSEEDLEAEIDNEDVSSGSDEEQTVRRSSRNSYRNSAYYSGLADQARLYTNSITDYSFGTLAGRNKILEAMEQNESENFDYEDTIAKLEEKGYKITAPEETEEVEEDIDTDEEIDETGETGETEQMSKEDQKELLRLTETLRMFISDNNKPEIAKLYQDFAKNKQFKGDITILRNAYDQIYHAKDGGELMADVASLSNGITPFSVKTKDLNKMLLMKKDDLANLENPADADKTFMDKVANIATTTPALKVTGGLGIVSVVLAAIPFTAPVGVPLLLTMTGINMVGGGAALIRRSNKLQE